MPTHGPGSYVVDTLQASLGEAESACEPRHGLWWGSRLSHSGVVLSPVFPCACLAAIHSPLPSSVLIQQHACEHKPHPRRCVRYLVSPLGAKGLG